MVQPPHYIAVQVHPGSFSDLQEWCTEHNATYERLIRAMDGGDDVYGLTCPTRDIMLMAKLKYGRSKDLDELVKALMLKK